MHILHCFKTNKLPLKIFLSGSAGVGKSTVINTIYQLLSIHFNEIPGENTDKLKILLCAPSGKAAFLIGGVTCHTAFALPVTQFVKQMPELSADIANTIRENLFHLKLLIIDEVSMVGSNMLTRIDTRLKQIFGVNRSFGGLSVILVGDLYQLPPVMDRPIFVTPNTTELSIFCDNILWEEFKYYPLKKIMRQQNDEIFINTLNNLAKGNMTDYDLELINSRITNEKDIPKEAIRLFGENKYVDEYNINKINSHPGLLYISKCIDTIIDKISEKRKNYILKSFQTKKRQECGGLSYELFLKIGIKYMITTNIDVEDGLVNGACGTLEYITFNENETPNIVWLNFNNNNKIGKKIKTKYNQLMIQLKISTNLVPIIKIDVIINTKDNHQLIRKQIPLIPAEALTVHKSQGQTYDKLCVDLTKFSKFKSRSLFYVAFSRVRQLSDLYIIGKFVNLNKTKSDNNLDMVMKDLKLNKNLTLSFNENIKGNKLIIIYQNIRSLHKNINYVINDRWFKQADLLIFSETFTKQTDIFKIDDYKIIYRSDNNNHATKGIICFAKKEIKCNIIDHITMNNYNKNYLHHIDMVLLEIKNIYILTGYKSPSVSKKQFFDLFENFYTNNYNEKEFILIGDYNFDTYSDNNFFEKYLNNKDLKRAINLGISITNFNTD